MPAIAALVLTKNDASTVTFTPASIDANGVATYYATAAVQDARWSVTWSVRNPKANQSAGRLIGKVTIPIMDTVDTSKKVDEVIGEVSVRLPRRATETQRLDMRKLLDTLLQNAVATAGFQYVENVY